MAPQFSVPNETSQRVKFFKNVNPAEFLAWRAERQSRPLKRGKPVQADTYRCVVQAMVTMVGARSVVEIGVWDGFLSRLLAAVPGVDLTVIDPWAPYQYYPKNLMDEVAKSVTSWANTMPNVQVKRMRSLDAVHDFEDDSIDFLHTDGDHSYEQVVEEVAAWIPKIKPGGLITGDNYEGEKVRRGVDKNLPEVKTLAKGRVWWYRIPLQ